jgi:hypothetical protein
MAGLAEHDPVAVGHPLAGVARLIFHLGTVVRVMKTELEAGTV